MDNSTMKRSALNDIISAGDTFADKRMRLTPHKVYDELVLIWPILWMIIVPPGIIANWLNIRTFFRMGLNDSVTISFFILALADFVQLFFPLANFVIMFLLYIEKKYSLLFEMQPLALVIYVANMGTLFNTWTSLITAFLAVQRCLCTFRPFHFKSMFTTSRTWYIMATFGVYSAVPAFAFMFATYKILPLSPAHSNGTQLVMVLRPTYKHVQFYADIIVFMGTSIACQVLSLGSLIVMAYCLAASVRFRQNATVTTTIREGGKTRDQQAGQEKKDRHATISKERTAIIQVALLSTIYLVSSLPRIAFSIGSFTVPEFTLNKKGNNLYYFGFILRVTFDYVNSALNFFVYYKYNSRFRKQCFGKVNNNNKNNNTS